MKRKTIENGGVEFSLKAHAVCATCTEFADFQVDAESASLESFGDAAKSHFRSLGWRCFEPKMPTSCPTCVNLYREVPAKKLKVGDVIVAKAGNRDRYTVVKIMPGLGNGPYLTLKTEDGRQVEHETAFDSYDATYTVENKE